jgi:hypothetical protein
VYLKIVYPLRDFRLGHAREEEACQGVRDCSTYIIFLSQNYLKLPHLISEWKYIWNSFAENNTREIIVINYDDMDTTNIEDDRMKALIRVGYSFDFFNIKKNLISDNYFITLQFQILKEILCYPTSQFGNVFVK